MLKLLFFFGGLQLFLIPQLQSQITGAQTPSIRCWIFFSGKPGLACNHSAIPSLSAKSLELRKQKAIPLDSYDYPVDTNFTGVLQRLGNPVIRRSRWLNAVSADLDLNKIPMVRALPFVLSVEPVRSYRVNEAWQEPEGLKSGDLYDSLFSFRQLQQLGLDKLHTHGYNGRGVTVAVFDTEFANADSNPAFTHLFQTGRILATHDFVNNETDVYSLNQGSEHGAWVLSILAGHIQENFMGSAPGASYILCHTENTESETHTEEDNWVAAAEWADSIGADIFTTSLGYSQFDALSLPGEFVKAGPEEESSNEFLAGPAPLFNDYDYNDMDGNTAIISRAADLAASRGIIVLNSAGNEGANPWHYITAPSDGDSVIAVGAIKSDSTSSSFSSRGPSADGRIKPDFVAMGQGNAYVTISGGIENGSGTSFSCPTLAGFCACILQASPGLSYGSMRELLRNSAWLPAGSDSTAFGYGLPNGPEILRELGLTFFTQALTDFDLFNRVVVYPVPATDPFTVIIQNNDLPYDASIRMFDFSGRKVFEFTTRVLQFNHRIEISSEMFSGQFPEGRLLLRITNLDTGEEVDTRSVYLLKN